MNPVVRGVMGLNGWMGRDEGLNSFYPKKNEGVKNGGRGVMG